MSKKIAYFLIHIVIILLNPFETQVEADSLTVTPAINQQAEYSLNVEGWKTLLLDLSRAGTADSYTIQLDGALDLSRTAIGENVIYSEPTPATINFVSVSPALTIKGSSSKAELVLPDTCFFGQDLHFEDLALQAPRIYGNGHRLLFEKIQHNQRTQLFGGSNQNLFGDPLLIFQQVIGGSWEIYGGNETGVLTGNPTIQIKNLVGSISQLCGGSLEGQVVGEIRTEINHLSGSLASYYGGGIGTEAEPCEVTGGITNQLASTAADFTLGNFVGGVAYGRCGPIQTTINGAGSFSSAGILIGGSQVGEIVGADRAITTHLDTRQFQQGERSFVGGNQYSGRIIGSIENSIYAGEVGKGSFTRIDGAGGMEIQKKALSNSNNLVPEVNLTDPQNKSPEEAFYDQLTAAERLGLAESKTLFSVEGNVTTHLLGGCVSGGLGNTQSVRGAGFAGVIKGNVYLILGEEDLVYSKRWGTHAQQMEIDPNSLPEISNLGSNYGFSASGGGGDSQSAYENTLFIKGTTNLIIRKALLGFAYGGSFSGTIIGNSNTQLHGGQVNRIYGAGGGCYRIYGDSRLEVTGGKVESIAAAGSTQDRQIANVSAAISGGEFLGVLAGSEGTRSNHLVDGNVELVVRGGSFKKKGNGTQIMGGIQNEGMIRGTVILKLLDSVKLAPEIQISAARPKNASSANKLGATGKQVKFELDTENPFSDIAVIGDGGAETRDLFSSEIKLRINAPNSTFSLLQGMLKNTYAGKLRHDLTLDIQAAASIKKIIGSDATTFSNRLIENSTAEVAIRLGAIKKELFIEEINNFTKMTVENKVSVDSIRNGNEATKDNFDQAYHQFGKLYLAESARLAVKELKTGELVTAEKAELHSPAGAEKIFLRKLTPDKKLTWRLLSPEEHEKIVGTYFTQQMGYPIMTFAGSESHLAPENFIGFDATGRAYTGDFNGNTGLAVAAAIIDYQVSSPLGSVEHNFSLKPDNQPLPLDVWGKTGEREGEIIVPAEKINAASLKFPETAAFSFQHAEIITSSGEQNIFTENSWRPTANYHYQVRVQFQVPTGMLKLLSVPTLLDFGQQPVAKETNFYPKIIGRLEVQDTRVKPEQWSLSLQAQLSTAGELYFKEAGQMRSLKEPQILFNQKGSLMTSFEDWSKTKGVCLTIPKEQQQAGVHELTFHWTLTTTVE
ncbi:hypothetical protein CF160_08400 [Enterococcus pseudoavium]|nr:hypothetical protein CF160_08400 [Enterococcus pseudoavium]